MFRNYLTTALRNIFKKKGYSILNILGLTIGMTCCLVIFHYVSYERSYDDFVPRSQDVVRLRLDNYQKGKLAFKSATVYPAIAPNLKKDYPEVEDFCRLIDANPALSTENNIVKFNETKGYYAEPSFLKIFDLPLEKGNVSTALIEPGNMIISETMAKKYFGNENPLGKKLVEKTQIGPINYEITGVFKKFPDNSHLIIDFLISWSSFTSYLKKLGDTSNATETSFGWYDFYSYLKLRPGTDWKNFEKKLPGFCDRYINSQEWYKNNNNRAEVHLIPVTDVHLYSNYNQEAEVNGSGQSVKFLFLIAIFIICIAWINYINLATARSVERAKEVGMRKVLGAVRANLIRQFMTESFLLNLAALIISIGLFRLLLPAFDEFTGRSAFTHTTLSPFYWAIFLSLFLLGTFLSGIYPSFILASFRPITVLKGIFKNTSGGISLRKGLIVAQFVISMVLIAGTIIVYQQVKFMRSQNLGANIDQTVVFKAAGSMQDSLYKDIYQPFKTELLQHPEIKTVTASSNVMGKEIYWTRGVKRVDVENETSVTLYFMAVDHDFIPAYQMKILAGRNFSTDFKTDERAVLLNETAVKLLGFKNPEDALNKKLSLRDTVTIVGVLADYHHQGLQKAIDPMIFLLMPNIRGFYSMKLQSADMHKTIATISSIWDKHFPADAVDYFFLDENYNQQYKADQMFGKVFGMFAFLAILIACFGLLGLTAFNVLQRTKEIGIRKVLGASVQNILLLLSKDFLRLIIIALILAVPIGWYVMHSWLQDFAYRIHIQWWVFIISAIAAILIALFTICLQAAKAAIANPVKSLRTE